METDRNWALVIIYKVGTYVMDQCLIFPFTTRGGGAADLKYLVA